MSLGFAGAQTAAQRRQARRELERMAKDRDREKLRRLRERVAELKQHKRQRMAEVRTRCSAQRQRNRERARAAREALRDAYAELRSQARQQCARDRARAKNAPELAAAQRELERERQEQATLRRWARPSSTKARARRSKAEVRQESDDEVRGNIDDPTLLAAFETVKGKIKAGPRRSRTEAFLEWAAEHRAEVWAAAEAQVARELEELERQERDLSRQLKKKAPYAGVTDAELEELAHLPPLSAVPF